MLLDRPNTRRAGRVLSEAELVQVWKACLDGDYRKIVKALPEETTETDISAMVGKNAIA